jgi:CubicO group peptidase (beta-lactamase class C family)
MAAVPPPPGVTLANWDLGGEPSAWAYLHAGELLPTVAIPVARAAAELELAEQTEIGRFAVEPDVTLDEYVAHGPVSGIVVVLHGQIAYQRYPRMRPGQRHFMMSVTKAFTSALVGILEQRGALDLSAPVDAVITELAGSGWAGVPAGDVLGMASGIGCPEDSSPGACTDPDHPFYRFEATLGWRPSGSPLPTAYEFVAGLPAGRPPGRRYEYVSANTFVLSWLIERATGLPFAEVLRREIWSQAGFEAPAQLSGSAAGAPGSHGGLSITLRDLARFGLLFTPSRRLVAGSDIITARHLALIQAGARPELHRRDPAGLPDYVTAAYGPGLPPASRQWNFAMADGDLFKGGHGGQGLYVSPGRDLVIAFAGVPRADGSASLLRWYSRRLARFLG